MQCDSAGQSDAVRWQGYDKDAACWQNRQQDNIWNAKVDWTQHVWSGRDIWTKDDAAWWSGGTLKSSQPVETEKGPRHDGEKDPWQSGGSEQSPQPLETETDPRHDGEQDPRWSSGFEKSPQSHETAKELWYDGEKDPWRSGGSEKSPQPLETEKDPWHDCCMHRLQESGRDCIYSRQQLLTMRAVSAQSDHAAPRSQPSQLEPAEKEPQLKYLYYARKVAVFLASCPDETCYLSDVGQACPRKNLSRRHSNLKELLCKFPKMFTIWAENRKTRKGEEPDFKIRLLYNLVQ